MLEKYFKTAQTCERLRRGSVGGHLDAWVGHMSSLGYAWLTIKLYLGWLVHFGRWLDRSRTALADIDDETVARFASHLRRCRCKTGYRGARCAHGPEVIAGVLHFCEFARHIGLARPPAPPSVPAVIVGFEEWMRAHRGTAPRTLADYRLHIGRLLESGIHVETLDAKQLRDHVLRMAQPRRAQAKVMVRALRMFVRFLVATGRADAHLEGAVPSVAYWRLATLPVHIPASDIQLMVASCPATPIGRRDRAVLLLLSRLGLRRGDLAALRIDDLDWANGRIHVRGKAVRSASLPLPQDVGDAILVYLRRGRPRASSRYVFLRACAPHRPLSSSAFGSVVDRCVRRAEVSTPMRGTHMFRHAVATTMLRRGASLNDIGLLLRHQSRDTTLQYAKVDSKLLRSIALPWPGSEP